MRMMGADSVDYHERTVAGRGDDPVAASGEYYSSRGETPMSWGGSGCGLLGLAGEVDLADYRAVFGIGGAHDPRTGRRLVGCLRPGLELVVSPHKSVAELGVIGRAEDMHEIVDAERDATLEYLDRLVSERGGRRGRAQTRVATGGLIWATSRHATTRAGDPQVHDHVLIANVLFMRDARGGWKGADTAFLRDHLHAATAVGRMAAAAKAVELGYVIVADPGPSGGLGGWAIAGIPAEVCAPGNVRPNRTPGFSKARCPVLPLRSVSSKTRNEPEPNSSRAILSSSTASASYAEPSKPNKPAPIAPALSPRTLQPRHRSCSGGAAGLPTSCRARQRFPRVPSSEPDPTIGGTGLPRKSRQDRRLLAVGKRITPDICGFVNAPMDAFGVVMARPSSRSSVIVPRAERRRLGRLAQSRCVRHVRSFVEPKYMDGVTPVSLRNAATKALVDS